MFTHLISNLEGIHGSCHLKNKLWVFCLIFRHFHFVVDGKKFLDSCFFSTSTLLHSSFCEWLLSSCPPPTMATESVCMSTELLNLLWFEQRQTLRIERQKVKEADTSWEFTLKDEWAFKKQAKQIVMKAGWPEAKSLGKEKTAVQRSSQNGNRRILNKIDRKVSFKCRSPWVF